MARWTDVRGVADYTTLSTSTLDKMRVRGDGPAYVRASGGRVVYDLDRVDEWLRARECRSTSDPGIPATAAA